MSVRVKRDERWRRKGREVEVMCPPHSAPGGRGGDRESREAPGAGVGETEGPEGPGGRAGLRLPFRFSIR